MTLIERLAREAVPAHQYLAGSVEAKMRELVEACGVVLDGYGIVPGRHPSYYADRIRALLTDQEPQP